MTDPRFAIHHGRATLSNSVWYLDHLITFLAVGEDTGGQFALLRVQAGQSAGRLDAHTHTQEDQTIYLLEGELTILMSGEALHACSGETVTIPRGVAHAVRHDTPAVTYLLHLSPAGFEHFFHEMSAPAEYLGLPPNPAFSWSARMAEAAQRYGCVFTEPLL